MTKRNTPYIHTLHLVLTPRNREEPKLSPLNAIKPAIKRNSLF